MGPRSPSSLTGSFVVLLQWLLLRHMSPPRSSVCAPTSLACSRKLTAERFLLQSSIYWALSVHVASVFTKLHSHLHSHLPHHLTLARTVPRGGKQSRSLTWRLVEHSSGSSDPRFSPDNILGWRSGGDIRRADKEMKYFRGGKQKWEGPWQRLKANDLVRRQV